VRRPKLVRAVAACDQPWILQEQADGRRRALSHPGRDAMHLFETVLSNQVAITTQKNPAVRSELNELTIH
jgi:hypothetical protein